IARYRGRAGRGSPDDGAPRSPPRQAPRPPHPTPFSVSPSDCGKSLARSAMMLAPSAAPVSHTKSRIKAAFAFDTTAVKPLPCLVLLAALIGETAHSDPTLAPAVPLPRPRPAEAGHGVSLVDRLVNDPDLLRIPDPDPPGAASDCQMRMTKD